MVSVLGNYSYTFPKKIKLEYLLRDFIDSGVDEKYYLPDELVKEFERYKEGDEDGNPS